jgi:hypothetical protein
LEPKLLSIAFFFGEGPRSRCYRQPCDDDD